MIIGYECKQTWYFESLKITLRGLAQPLLQLKILLFCIIFPFPENPSMFFLATDPKGHIVDRGNSNTGDL